MTIDDQLARVTHERDMLAEAIADAAIKAGIYNGIYGKSAGPMMLQLANDMAEVIKDLEHNMNIKADFIDATINDLATAEFGRDETMYRALEAIIERSKNGELGTSKVIDMRKIAEKALASVQ